MSEVATIKAERMWELETKDPTGLVLSASIVELTDGKFCLSVSTKWSYPSDFSTSLVAAKRMFGRAFFTGATWRPRKV